MRRHRGAILVATVSVVATCAGGPRQEGAKGAVRPLRARAVALPGGGAPGIGFDDLRFAPALGGGLGRLLIPAGRSGRLDVLDPASGRISSVTGFSRLATYGGGHDDSVTSADAGGGWIYATDRTSRRLLVIDPARGRIVGSAALSAGPDYVRWVAPTGEVWVTEPDADQIEVFAPPAARATAGATGPGSPVARARIPVPGGPESLVISPRRGRAYSHLWRGKTVAVDLRRRQVVATWVNGCRGSRGIALDPARGWLFAGCSEGRATLLDVDHGGRMLGRISVPPGIDVIAYAPALRRLYLASARRGVLTVVAVAPGGSMRAVARGHTAAGAHCAATDGRGRVWVCDPHGGRLLRFDDPAAAPRATGATHPRGPDKK